MMGAQREADQDFGQRGWAFSLRDNSDGGGGVSRTLLREILRSRQAVEIRGSICHAGMKLPRKKMCCVMQGNGCNIKI